MKKNSAHSNECFNLDDIVNVLLQELDDARKEHDIGELEDLSDTFGRLTDVRSRLDDDIELLRTKFKQLGLS